MTEVEQICDRVGVIRRRRADRGGHGRRAARPRAPAGARRAARRRAACARRRSPRSRAWRLSDGALRIAADPAAAAAINRALVEAGIGVSELRVERASLEDVFLQLTKEAA